MMEGILTRRDFLRVAAGAAAVGGAGAACGSGSEKPKQSAKSAGAGKGERTLRIAQWGHFVPAYDAWFDGEYTQRWGEEHNVKVVVDHLPFADIRTRAD